MKTRPKLATDEWLGRLEEIVRLTAPPASATEICEQGLARMADAVGAGSGAIVIRAGNGGPASAVAFLGDRPSADHVAAAEAVLPGAGASQDESSPLSEDPWVLPLRLEPGAAGVLVLEGPGRATAAARSFVTAAAQAIASALRGARAIDSGREQAALLARRNLQLEILRDLGALLHEGTDEERMLASLLDRLVERLGLDAGWIFWGEERRGRLALAAARGLPADFVAPAREGEMTPCLCLDVFRTGRLGVARNTTECPRLPHLLSGGARTHACIPLRFERGVLGVLNVAGRAGLTFTREELEFLETVGTQVCLAVDKLRTGRAEDRAHRETRDALVRLQKAQEGMVRSERLAAVGTLASSLAHEVRNPLNSIALTLVLLTRRLARLEADPSLEAMVETVRKEVERLNALVGEFLSLATLDRLQPETTDPRTLVRDALSLLGPLASTQKVEVRDETDAEAPDIPLDRRKMMQVLVNLLRNAIDAMPQGGVLTTAVRRRADGVEITVSDTGPGIEPGLDVFSFFTSTKHGGTGLGLPISRGIVEAHGGRLSYDSEPGRGTTFRVTLPATRPAGSRSAEGS